MSSIRKKVRPGEIELAADGRALEVHYESQEIAVLPDGQELPQSTKQGVKRIKLELLEDVDLAAAAQRIVEGSKLLHASRLAQVHALLEGARRQHQLEPDRQPEQLGMGPSARVSPDGSIAAPFLALSRQVSERDRQLLREEQQHALAAAAAALRAAAATASLDRLEDYLEALYEESLPPKTAAAAAVAQLASDPACLPPLLAHPTLLPALARLLREEARRGADLAAALLSTFLALSRVVAAHPLLAQNQVGALTMDLLGLEGRRTAHWAQQAGAAVAPLGVRLLRRQPLPPAERGLAAALARQEPLLRLALALLLSLGEEPAVQQKMVNKGLLGLLCPLLERGSPPLLLLAISFLHRLSIPQEHAAALREAGLAAPLAALLPGADDVEAAASADGEDGRRLLAPLLKLLHSLSCDEGMRGQMAAAGTIARVAALLPALPASDRDTGGAAACSGGGGGRGERSCEGVGAEPSPLQLALGLLHNLSLLVKHRTMFLRTDALPCLHAMLLSSRTPLLSSCPQLAALMASLAGSCRVAEEMARGGRLEQLVEMAVGPAEPPLEAVADERTSKAVADSQGRGVEGGGATEAPAGGAEAAAGNPKRGEAAEARPEAAADGGEGAEEAQLSAEAAAEGKAEGPEAGAGPAAQGPWAEDAALWALLRQLAAHESEPLRARFAPALPRLAVLLTRGELPPPALRAVLACLARLHVPGFAYAPLLASTQLPAFLATLAGQLATAAARGGSDGAAAHTALLDCMSAVGVMCADDECAEMLAAAGLAAPLHALLLDGGKEEQEDESLLVATSAAARLLAQAPSRAALLARPELAARLAELLRSSHRQLARAAAAALDAAAAASPDWAASVRRLKFEAHNREWLQVVAQMDAAAAAAAAEGTAQNEAAAQRQWGRIGGDQQRIGAFWGGSPLAAA